MTKDLEKILGKTFAKQIKHTEFSYLMGIFCQVQQVRNPYSIDRRRLVNTGSLNPSIPPLPKSLISKVVLYYHYLTTPSRKWYYSNTSKKMIYKPKV